MKKYINMLENYPIAVMGTALGVITLTNAYATQHMTFLRPWGVAIEIITAIAMLLKFVIFPKSVWKDLNNHIAGSFYGAIDMGLFLVAAYFHKDFPRVTEGFWIFCLLLHCLFIAIYSYFRIKNHKFSEMVPSWFVTYVGIATATMTSVGLGNAIVAMVVACFATICYLGFYFFMLYKVFFKKLEKSQITTVGIMAAPAALVLGALMTAFKDINVYLFWFIIITMIFNILIDYYFIWKLFRHGFNPGLAAFTFPLAVSTLVTFNLDKHLKLHHMWGVGLFKGIGYVELVVASLVILYVGINFLIVLCKSTALRNRA